MGANSTAGLNPPNTQVRQRRRPRMPIYSGKRHFPVPTGAATRVRTRRGFAVPWRGEAAPQDAWLISLPFPPRDRLRQAACGPLCTSRPPSPRSVRAKPSCSAPGAAAAPAPAGTAAAERSRGGP